MKYNIGLLLSNTDRSVLHEHALLNTNGSKIYDSTFQIIRSRPINLKETPMYTHATSKRPNTKIASSEYIICTFVLAI